MTSEIINSVILGIVEGVTEFLPVSSTGHLLLMDELLGFQGPPGHVFDIVIQSGAILAVVLLYFTRLWTVLVKAPTDPSARHFIIAVLIGFLPAMVIGAVAHGFIKAVLFNPWVVAVSLVVGGGLILWIERMAPPAQINTIETMPLRKALAVGFCQCLAMVPGVSRSGATIMGAMLLGVERKVATEFSFFLAIPTMAGATVYDLYKNRDALSGNDMSLIGIGFIVAFLSALVVVRGFVGFISKHGFTPFAWYRIAVGLGALGLLLMR